jgi:CRP-like cAMP-binding protein
MAAICSEVTRLPATVSRIRAPIVGAVPQGNQLLAGMPADIREILFPRLQRVWLPLGSVLHEAGDRMRQVYFPTDSLVSLSMAMEDGTATEIAAVGNEGLVGLAGIMGGESSLARALVVDPGSAFSVSRACLMEFFHGNTAVQQLLLRYAQASLFQVAQTAACNRRHSVEQQFCRWLLQRLDHSDSLSVNATHEAIANVLGVRRETISQVAGRLQKLDLIHLSRCRLEVIDRSQIEALCCECYFVVRKETDRLLPPATCNLPRIRASSASPPAPIVSGRLALPMAGAL